MKKGDLFYIFSFITFLFVRIYLFLFQNKHIYIRGILIHHFYIGLILFLTGIFLFKFYQTFSLVIFGVGAGLIVDELVFILLGGGLTPQYLSPISFNGAIVCMILLFIFRKKVVSILME